VGRYFKKQWKAPENFPVDQKSNGKFSGLPMLISGDFSNLCPVRVMLFFMAVWL